MISLDRWITNIPDVLLYPTATGMDAAIVNLRAIAEAASKVEFSMKRARKDTFAPRKKARTSSIKEDTSLMDERSEPLGSYWTTVPDRRGDTISVRRSHRLTRS